MQIYPEDDLEASLRFLNWSVEFVLGKWGPSASVACEPCLMLAGMLEKLRDDCEHDFIHPLLTKTISFILERLEPFATSIHESAFRLYAAAFNLRGNTDFCRHFMTFSNCLLNRLRERSLDNSCMELLKRAFFVYYFRYSDAWATYLDRTEACLSVIFPLRRKNVLSCDDSVEGVADFVNTIVEKLPKFAVNELIKRLLKQCSAAISDGLENFPLDRLNIAIRALVHLEKLINEPLKTAQRSTKQHLQHQLGELSVSNIKNETIKIVEQLVELNHKNNWNASKHVLEIAPSKRKKIALLNFILKNFNTSLSNERLLEFVDCEATAETAKMAWDERARLANADRKALIQASECHNIACLVYNRKIEPLFTGEYSLVYEFFERAFSYGEYSETIEDEEWENNPVLRSAIGSVLDALSMYDSKNLLQDYTLRLESAEIEHFGRIVDVYFIALGCWEALVKTVYLEKMGRGNFLVRSWGSLVGFKQKSREIADFLCGLLGASDDRLRMRVLDSFRFLPGNKVPEFLKLFERFRLPVSDDLVHLRYDTSRRARRHERCKAEVTRFYAYLISIPTITVSWVYKAALRHLVELYYFLSKIEVENSPLIDDLKVEFGKLLFSLAQAVNDKRDWLNWKQFFPRRFQAELRKSCQEWLSACASKDGKQIFQMALSEMVYIYDQENKAEIFNWITKQTEKEQSSRAVQNCLKSLKDEEELREELIEDFIKLICLQPEANKSIFEGLSAAQPADDRIRFLKFVFKEGEMSTDLIAIAIEMTPSINCSALQRKILLNMQEYIEFSSDNGFLYSIMAMTNKLRDSFPLCLKAVWLKIAEGSFVDLVHALQMFLMKSGNALDKAAVFVAQVLYDFDPNWLVQLLLAYAHPFSGAHKSEGSKRNPLEVSLVLLTGLKVKHDDLERSLQTKIKVINKLSTTIVANYLDCSQEQPFTSQEDLESFARELLIWATECPLKKVSWAAWRGLHALSSQLTDSFIRNDLLNLMRRFLRHLVCPGTWHYFDTTFVADILSIPLRMLNENAQLSQETIHQIFVDAVAQSETVDAEVFDAVVQLISSALEYQEVWSFLSSICDASLAKLHHKLITNGLHPNHYRLLGVLLAAEASSVLQDSMSFASRIERFFCYFIGTLPQLFTFFDENLSHERPKDAQSQEITSDFQEYLSSLIWLSQSAAQQSSNDDAKFLFMEIGELLASVESGKSRSSSDFYTNLANLLCDRTLINVSAPFVLKFMETQPCLHAEFSIKFATALRRERFKSPNNSAFAMRLISQSIELDQSVLDFLLNSS